MFRMWFRFVKDAKLVNDKTVFDVSDRTRTKKIFAAIDQVCEECDLSHPIWLDKNIDEFRRMSRTRFTSDNFVDGIDFDYLEISVIEEDY
ncbi:MAG: hypothetical protein VZR00_08990 [Lachnospiraceae bacterium]|jgi:hypothetical protein|nr:hypothetical protein [Lachnospiraceae bacterium]MEE3462004.1 hypothetical protein [Lachnospiraceae bacterium]